MIIDYILIELFQWCYFEVNHNNETFNATCSMQPPMLFWHLCIIWNLLSVTSLPILGHFSTNWSAEGKAQRSNFQHKRKWWYATTYFTTYFWISCKTHTHTHTHIHTQKHTHTHARTHTRMHSMVRASGPWLSICSMSQQII